MRSPYALPHHLGDHDQPAGQLGAGGFQAHGPRRRALLLAFLAQRVQVGEAFLVALAPGGHAITQPILLPRDPAAELVALDRFLFQHRIAPGLERLEALVQRAGDAAVEPDGGAGQSLQQPAVMAGEHEAGAHAGQFGFKPLDAGQVQMVGWFVEQQDVGRWGQHAGQRGAARFAAGQGGGVFIPGQAELIQQIARAMAVGVGCVVQPVFHVSLRGGEAGQVRLLRQVADGGAGLGEAAAGIGLDQIGGDAQQGGLAGAVASDQADAVAGRRTARRRPAAARSRRSG